MYKFDINTPISEISKEELERISSKRMSELSDDEFWWVWGQALDNLTGGNEKYYKYIQVFSNLPGHHTVTSFTYAAERFRAIINKLNELQLVEKDVDLEKLFTFFTEHFYDMGPNPIALLDEAISRKHGEQSECPQWLKEVFYDVY